MDEKVNEFLTHHRVGTISILNANGLPHSAAVHFAHATNPLKIYIVTEKKSKKAQGLLEAFSAAASFVTGFSEEEWITFQADGDVHIPNDEKELTNAKDAYYAKYPASKADENDPSLTFLIFTPAWWRYTNLNPDPWEIISSE